LVPGDGKQAEVTGLSGGKVEVKVAQFIRLSGENRERIGLGRLRKAFGSIIDLIKININKRAGDGLAGGQRGAVGVDFRRIEGEGGREDDGANVGVIVAWRRSGNTGRSRRAIVVINGVETDFGGLRGDERAVELKVTEVVGVSGQMEIIGVELDSGFGGSVAIQSKISLTDYG